MSDTLKRQVGGKHYTRLAIQPIEYILKNDLGFCEGNAIKYLSRWMNKGGVEDLKKARHYIDMLIEWVEEPEELEDDGYDPPGTDYWPEPRA